MALKVGKGDIEQEGSDHIVRLRKRYEINSQKPLPELDSLPARAFEAAHLRDKNRRIFAYVCDPKIPPRLNNISALHRTDHRYFLQTVDWDVVYWPPEDRRCPVLICERPNGKKILKDSQDTRDPMKEDKIIESFLTPIVQVLRDMHKMGICHGNIRPDNLYLENGEEKTVMLGECYVAPPLISLPIAYNTIINGLCSPGGRGRGDSSDDMYAVGVCILALATGEDPTNKYATEEDIQKAKLAYGSYGALAQRYRITNSLMEPMRGLLNDDSNDRWRLEELFFWLNGRRLSPKQQLMPPKASRSYKFLGKRYGSARELAYGFAEDWQDAIPAIQDGIFDNWLRRSLQDDRRVEAMGLAKNMPEPTTPAEADRLMARVLMALSDDRPIQLKSFAATLEGVPQLMGLQLKDPETRRLFLQLMETGLIAFYLELHIHDWDDLTLYNKMDKARGMLTQKGYGGGIERLAYNMNPSLPCMSPMFERDYIPNIDYLLFGINRHARLKGEDIVTLIDRDIVAYIAVHFQRQIVDELRALNMGEHRYEKALAEIRILTKLQEAAPTKRGMPDLCTAAAIILKPAVERFHSTEIREKVTKKLSESTGTGKLIDVLRAVDDPEDNKKDKVGFELACIEYADSVHAQIVLHNDVQQRAAVAINLAGQISSGLSALFAVFVAFGYAVYGIF